MLRPHHEEIKQGKIENLQAASSILPALYRIPDVYQP